MDEDKNVDKYIIPKNYDTNLEFKGIPFRNMAEALFSSLLAWQLMQMSPFVATIRTVGGIILVIACAMICIFGIRGESVTQFLITFIKFKKAKRTLHLRRTGYVAKKEREDRGSKKSGKDDRKKEKADRAERTGRKQKGKKAKEGKEAKGTETEEAADRT